MAHTTRVVVVGSGLEEIMTVVKEEAEGE